jgi:two-component system, chemotaxis family, CheB/CheR fusion protein
MESGHSFRHIEVGRSVFVQVLDSLDACVGLLDVDGTVIELNAAALAATDLDRAAVVGRPFAEMPCWSWSEQVQGEIRGQIAMAAGGGTQRGEFKLCLGADRFLDLQCSLKPVIDDFGRVSHLVWTGTDVTARVRNLENANIQLSREVGERRRAEALVLAVEEQLRRQLEELETIYRKAPVGLALFDRDLRYLRINQRLADLNGRRIEDHIGKTISEVIPDMARVLAPMLRQVFATGTPVQEFELRGRTAAAPDLERHRLVHYYPLKADDGSVRAVAAIIQDVTERNKVAAALRESERWSRERLEELEALYREAPVGLCLIGSDLRFLRINKRLAEINGIPVEAHIGHCIEEIVPDVAATVIPLLRRVFETGEPLQNVEIEGETARYPGARRFWNEDFYPLKNEAGEVRAVGIIVRDVTERKRAEEQRELLLAELEHRVKNTLASVMSVAAHTLRDGSELAAARDAFIGRLHALSHAHDLLAAGNWRGADLEQLVRRALEPYLGSDGGIGGGTSGAIAGVRGTVEGPSVFLQPRAAVTLGMIVHELATNAAKYGSLSSPEGRLDVSWLQQGSGPEIMLRLVWRETQGPPVTAPSRSGFGRTLIERGLKHDLGGDAQLEFHPEGLMCTLSLPLNRTALPAAGAS